MRHVSSNAETTARGYPDPKISSILQNIKQKIDSPHQLEIQVHQLAELLDFSHSNHKMNSCFVSDSNAESLLIQAINKHSGNDLVVFASCKCLFSMIDSLIHSQNELVNKMLKSGILQALHLALTEMKDKNSPQTIQVILILIQRIFTISQDVPEIKEHVVFDDCIWIVENTNLQKDIRIQALEILQKLISKYSERQNKDLVAKYHKNITNVLQREIENKNINLVMPLLNASVQLCSLNEPNSNQFSSESPEIKIHARALNTFPEDKSIKSVSFIVDPLTSRKICTKFLSHTFLEEEVGPIIQNLEGGKFDQILLLNILFLRNETIHLCVSKGAINYIQNALEALLIGFPINTELIATSLIALIRIADLSEKYVAEIMNDRGLELLFKVGTIKDPEIIKRTCECLERLVINEKAVEKLINNKFIDILVQNVNNLKSNDEDVLKSLLLLLRKLVQLKPNLKSIMEENIVQVLGLVLCMRPKDKLLNILSSEFLAQLRIASLSSLNMSNVLSYIKHIICLYPGWNKARVPVLSVTSKIYEHKGRLDLTQSERNLLDLLIIFLSSRFERQSFDLIREEYFENFGLKFDENAVCNVKDDLEEDMRSIVQETLQRLIRTHVICEKLGKFNESYQKFVAKPGKDEAVDLSLILEFISAISQVASLGMIIIKEQIPKRVLKIAEIALASENIFIKEILLRDCALFFENLSKTPEISQDLDLQKTAISVLFLILNTQASKPTLLQVLHTIQAFIVSGLFKHNAKITVSKEELSLETAINLALSRISSFGEDHTIEELGIDLLKTALDINKLGHTSLILKAGGIRFCISIIENVKVPFSLLAKTLSLIDVLLESKEALMLFTQNEAYVKIMRFLGLNIEMTEAFEAAKKPLEKLAKAQTEAKAREYKAFIEELLDSLASGDLETDEKNVTETLKEILCLSIVEDNAKFILEKRGLLIFMSLIQNESPISQSKKGQKDIQVNTEVLNVGLFAIYQLYVYASKHDSFDVKDEIIKMKFISTLSEIIFNKQTSHETVFHALQLMVVLTLNNQLQEIFAQECLANNYIEKLSSMLETYKEDTKIARLIAEVIFQLTQASKEIALQLGQNLYIDSLLQEIKHVLRFCLNKEQDLDLVLINLKYLLSISAQFECASKIIESDGLNAIFQLLSSVDSETSNFSQLKKPGCSQKFTDLCFEIFSNIAAHKSLASKFFDQGLLDIILPFIKPQTDLNLMLKTLKLFTQACSIANHREYLIKYGLLNEILNLNTVFSGSGSLQSIIAELTEILGGNALIPSIGNQFISLSQQLNIDNKDLINQYIQKALYLAGLFVTRENAEIEENMPFQVIESIDKTLLLSKDNPDLITAQMLLMKRLVNRDQSIKEQLINSALLELIVTDILGNKKFLTYDTKTKRTVLEFVQGFATRKEHNTAVNGVTGEDIVIEDEVNVFLYAFIGDKGEALRNLIEIAKLKTCEESLLAVSILAGLASSSAKIATEIVQNEGVAIGFSYFMDEVNNVKVCKNNLLGLSLLKELVKISKASKEILENSTFIKFVEKLQEIEMQTSYEEANETKILIQVLEVIGNVSKNVHLNRVLLNDLKLVETLTGFVRKLTHLPHQQFKEEHTHLFQIITHSLKAIQNLTQDPLLARSFIRENGIQDAFNLIKIFASVTLTEKNKASLEDLMQLSDLASSPSYLNKAIEETLGVIERISRRNKYSSSISLITDDSDLYQSLLNLLSNRIDDPIIGLHTLKIFQKRLMTMTREDLLENLEVFIPICDLADSLMEVYPNIEIINKYGNSLKGLICSGMGSHDHRSEESNLLYQEKVQNTVQKIMNESGVEDICELLDLIEHLLSINDGKEWSEDEYIGFMIAISTLRDQMSENSVAEIVRRHGIGYDLAKAILRETIDEDTRNYVLQILQMIFAEKCSSVDDNITQDFIDNITKYLQILSKNAGINKTSNIELIFEIVKDFMHNLKRPANVNLKPLATAIGQFKGLILQNPKTVKLIIKCADEMIDYASMTAESFIDLGISISKALSLNKIDCDAGFLQLYSEFIAKSANNFDLRDVYGKNDIITVLVKSGRRYSSNSELNKSICASYQSLSYQHTENSTLLLNSPAISYIKSQLSLPKQESILVETVCDLIATLLSNLEAPSLLMKEGVLDELFSLLKNETDFIHAESTCKCLDTIEKFAQESIVINTIIEKGYMEIVLDFLRKPLNAIDTVGSALGIIKSIVARSKESVLFKSYCGEIVTELLNLLPICELNKELISLQINILSSLSLVPGNVKLISNNKGSTKVLKILKIYDFDRNIVTKCLEIVNATLLYEQNIDIIMSSESIQLLNSLMLIHKEADHILLTLFKVINQYLTGPDKCHRLQDLYSLQTCFIASEESLFQPETAIEFLKLLTKFAIVEDIAAFICEAGGLVVLNKIKENAQYPKVMDIGLRLLMSLITIGSNLSILLDNGLLETLSSIVEIHSGDEDIITQAARVLYLVETSADGSHKEQIKSQLESILRMCPQGEEMYRKLKLKQRGNTTPELKRPYQSRKDHFNLTNSSHKDPSIRLPLKERVPFDLEKNLQDFDNSDKCKANYSGSKYSGNISANKVTDMNQEAELFGQGRSVKIWLSNGGSLYTVLRLSGDNSEIYAQAEDKPTEKKLKIRVDEIQEVKKGYDSSSPFVNPKKCYEKGPNKDLCFSIIAKSEKSNQKSICVECLMPNDREKFLEQIRKLIIQ